MKLSRFIFILMTFFCLQATAFALAADAVLQVGGIRYGQHATKTRIVIDLNQKADFRAFHLADPNRIVLDIPHARFAVARSKSVHDGLIKSYRSGEVSGNLTRIVFDLNKPALISNVFFVPKDDFSKDRIVIDLSPSSQNVFNARAGTILGNKTLTSSKPVSAPVSRMRALENAAVAKASPEVAMLPVKKPPSAMRAPEQRKYIVVIDPGHGGQDPGAIGQGGVYEKHVTLAAAKALKQELEETGRYKVVLTRSSDHYIKLRERVNIARRANADLFISLHADKISRKDVRGASIYTLSEKASDAETERLAESENNAGVVAGVDLATESQDIANILLDLAMREKMNESNLLARYINDSFRRGGVKMLPNSHRSAGFAVLKAPDVPSILIEMGFLSNSEEAKLLRTASFQSKIAKGIAAGVDSYFRKIEALKKI